MKRDLTDILVCPTCRSGLTLEVTEEEGGEVVSGSLRCAACGEAYPIEDSIPNLLPPELRRE